MPDVNEEIDAKLSAAQAELEATRKERASAEQALEEATDAVRQRHEALNVVLAKEGTLRGTIGELERMRMALKDAPD